jgi:hypothetical protein
MPYLSSKDLSGDLVNDFSFSWGIALCVAGSTLATTAHDELV